MCEGATECGTVTIESDGQGLQPPYCIPYFQPHWYAVHTCSRREKQIARVLEERGIESFLPLYQRSPRNGCVRPLLPLFPGYVFVHIVLRDCLRVLQVPGVVRLLSFRGHPAELSDDEIQAIRVILQKGLDLRPYPYMNVGQLVEIHHGPLQGTRGRVLRRSKRLRIVLSVDALGRSLVVEVNEDDLTDGWIAQGNRSAA